MSRMYCDCHGATHPLIDDGGCAMICYNCGNIYCEQQGRGPCLFCGMSKLAADAALPDKQLEYWRTRKLDYQRNMANARNKGAESKNADRSTEDELDMATQQFREIVYRNLEDAFASGALVDDQFVAFDDLGE